MNGVIDAAIFATSPGSRGADDHATLSTCDLYDATSDVGAARTVTDYLLEELCDLRAVLGLRLHRFGYEADDQKQELRRYLFGRRLVKRIDMTQPLHAILRRLHASITSGQEGDSSFREVNVASISRHEGAQANVNRTRHQDVPRLIEETEARILRSSCLFRNLEYPPVPRWERASCEAHRRPSSRRGRTARLSDRYHEHLANGSWARVPRSPRRPCAVLVPLVDSVHARPLCG